MASFAVKPTGYVFKGIFFYQTDLSPTLHSTLTGHPWQYVQSQSLLPL